MRGLPSPKSYSQLLIHGLSKKNQKTCIQHHLLKTLPQLKIQYPLGALLNYIFNYLKVIVLFENIDILLNPTSPLLKATTNLIFFPNLILK